MRSYALHLLEAIEVEHQCIIVNNFKIKNLRMKKLNLLLMGLLIGLLIFQSCSSDDNQNTVDDSNVNISKWVNKKYTFSDYLTGNYDESGILTDSIEYTIVNNKITAFSGFTNINDVAKSINGNISYSNNKITQYERYKNNQLVLKLNYQYDSSGELIEYKCSDWVTSSQEFEYFKSEFTHTIDTVFSKFFKSSNDIQYDLKSTSKIVLDENNNRLYNEVLSESGFTGIITSTYDSSNNMNSNNIYTNVVYNFTYSDVLNTEGFISNNTFGKKVNMLLFGEGSGFSPKRTSTNEIESVSSNNVANTYEYMLENESNQNNYSIRTSYKEKSGLAGRLEISEFEFE